MNIAAKAEAAPSNDWSWRSPAYAWWVVTVLALGLTLALMDRMIIALMIEPIKRDLQLTDTQISLVHGMAFTLTYILAGLPLGRIADRSNRTRLAALCIIFWSIMTALCGGATTFLLLFLARLGVGIGEAGISPAAFSLVSDYFPKERRTKPLAFLTIGTTAGAGLALMGGGLIMHAVSQSAGVDLPLIGRVETWQMVFILLGFGGVAFAALFLTVREPLRREQAATAQPRVSELVAFLAARRGYFIPQFFGPALAVLALISFHSWMPTMLIRRFDWTIGQAGLFYGALITAAGCTGVIMAGRISERLVQRGYADAPNLVAGYAAAAAIPFLVAAPFLPDAWMTLALLFPGLALVAVPSTLAPAALQAIVPNEMRGQTFAVYLLVLSMLGYALGPLAVALLTDKLFADEQLVHYSLAFVAAVALPLAALSLVTARRAAIRLIG